MNFWIISTGTKIEHLEFNSEQKIVILEQSNDLQKQARREKFSTLFFRLSEIIILDQKTD